MMISNVPPIWQKEIYDDTLNHIWTAEDDDDLIEEITSTAGFFIQSINYRQLPEVITQ
jgi:hypothetical protein